MLNVRPSLVFSTSCGAIIIQSDIYSSSETQQESKLSGLEGEGRGGMHQTSRMLNLILRASRSSCCVEWSSMRREVVAVGEIEWRNFERSQFTSGKQLWRASASEKWNWNNFLPPRWITSFLEMLYHPELWGGTKQKMHEEEWEWMRNDKAKIAKN